jgi:hypothetical protein
MRIEKKPKITNFVFEIRDFKRLVGNNVDIILKTGLLEDPLF